MNKLTLTAKLVLSFGLMVVIVAVLTVTSYLSLAKIDLAAETAKVKMHKMEAALNMKFDARATMDVFADLYIGQDLAVIEEIRFYLDEFEAHLEVFKEDADEEEVRLAAELDSAHEPLDQACNDGIALAEAGDFVGVLAVLEERIEPAIAALDEKIADAVTDVSEDVNLANDNADAAIGLANLTGLILGLVGLVVGILAALLIIASIRNPLNKLVAAATSMANGDFTIEVKELAVKDEIGRITTAFIAMKNSTRALIETVAKAATSVASSSEELAAGADETGKAIQEVATTVGEMAKGSQNAVANTGTAAENLTQNAKAIEGISKDIEEVAAYATQAAAQGAEGKKNADDAAEIISRAAESVRETTKVVHLLGEKTNQIGEFIGIITGIADQTNLLALNAAIEAARAGDAGRGFAVVAEEVRKLAEESNGAAGNITSLVKGIEAEMQNALAAMERSDKEVSEGSTTVNQASKMLDEIVHGVEALNDKVQNISASAEQINASTGEVVSAITTVASEAEEAAAAAEEVSASTEEQTASMEEISANASNLATLAQGLQEEIAKFKV